MDNGNEAVINKSVKVKKASRPITELCEPDPFREEDCIDCVCYECPDISCEKRIERWKEHCSIEGACNMTECLMHKERLAARFGR